MIGIVLGWYARRLWDKYKQSLEPPVEPLAIYHGHVTANNAVAGPLRRECRISEPLDETGLRKILEDGPHTPACAEWLTTFRGNHDGQLLVRFQTPSDARTAMEDCSMGDEFQIEFHRVAKGKVRSDRELKEQVESVGFQAPFGSPPGGGGGIS